MKRKMDHFIPAMSVRLISEPDYERGELDVVTDNGKRAKIFLRDPKGEKIPAKDLERYAKERIGKYASSENVLKHYAKKVESDPEFAKLVDETVQTKMKEGMSAVEALKYAEKMKKEAAEGMAKEDYVLRKGAVISIGGIVKDSGKILSVVSNVVKFDEEGNVPRSGGFYIHSVRSDAVPAKATLVRTKESEEFGKISVAGMLCDRERLDALVSHMFRTMEDYSSGKSKTFYHPTLYVFGEDKALKALGAKLANRDGDDTETIKAVRELGGMILDDPRRLFTNAELYLPVSFENVRGILEDSLENVKRAFARTAFSKIDFATAEAKTDEFFANTKRFSFLGTFMAKENLSGYFKDSFTLFRKGTLDLESSAALIDFVAGGNRERKRQENEKKSKTPVKGLEALKR